MTEPRTEAGKRLWDRVRIHNIAQRVRADDRHDARWLADIAAIENEAVAARNAELAEKVRGLPLVEIADRAPGPIGAANAVRAAVLALIEEVASPNREPGAL